MSLNEKNNHKNAIEQTISSILSGDTWPRLLNYKAEGDEVRVSLAISNDISWFAGHFPEQAVLPGVVQVHWATVLSRSIFASVLSECEFKAVNNLKFKTVILPDQTIDLILQYKPTKSMVSFTYRSEDDVFSTGTLVFSTP